MARINSSVKPITSAATPPVEVRTTSVVETAERLSIALRHLERASHLAETIQKAAEDLYQLRKAIANWKLECQHMTDGLGVDLTAAMQTAYAGVGDDITASFILLSEETSAFKTHSEQPTQPVGF